MQDAISFLYLGGIRVQNIQKQHRTGAVIELKSGIVDAIIAWNCKLHSERRCRMNSTGFQLTVFGARGSMTVCRKDTIVFGGDTSCYLVQAGEESIFLDAGSGLIAAPVSFPRTPVILLSHLHLDHVLGLGMYPRMAMKGMKTALYLPAASSEEAVSVLDSLYTPPFWPLHLSDYAGDLQVEPLRFPLTIGEVLVEGMAGNHPGDCAVMRLHYRGKSLVYVTDYEYEEASFQRLAAFARDTDLLLYDGQYDAKTYEQRKGFGHSTPDRGLELMGLCGAKRLLLIHHDPLSSDDELQKREYAINRTDVRFARVGDIIEL